MIKNDSYVMIPGWVINKYQLKGNMMMIYSIIYGFCQDRESNYHGSLAYLAEWTQSTRQSVSGCLKQLCEMGLIRKEEGYPNNKYYIIFEDESSKNESKDSLQGCKDSLHECKESLHPCKDSLHNNIEYISNNNIENNKDEKKASMPISNRILDNNNVHTSYAQSKKLSESIGRIVGHFNQVCGTQYRVNSSGIQKVIKARFKEGFNEEDFIKVIDNKYADWGVVPRKLNGGGTTLDLLRPSILFGEKMDEYLQQVPKPTSQVRSVRQDPALLTDIVY